MTRWQKASLASVIAIALQGGTANAAPYDDSEATEAVCDGCSIEIPL
jgi:hypothetical protein